MEAVEGARREVAAGRCPDEDEDAVLEDATAGMMRDEPEVVVVVVVMMRMVFPSVC